MCSVNPKCYTCTFTEMIIFSLLPDWEPQGPPLIVSIWGEIVTLVLLAKKLQILVSEGLWHKI